jgi:hypothetical protein
VGSLGLVRHAADRIVDLLALSATPLTGSWSWWASSATPPTGSWSWWALSATPTTSSWSYEGKNLQCRMTYILIASATMGSLGASGLVTYKNVDVNLHYITLTFNLVLSKPQVLNINIVLVGKWE